MGGKLKWYLLAVIFAVVLGARLFFAFSTPYLNSDDSFFHFRQAEHISKTGLPLTNDLLSAGGKTIIQSPLFDYVLAIGFALPHSLKILPNILAALLVIPVFLIVLWLTKNTPISLLFAFLSGFVPIFFTKTFNHLTPLALSLPLIFFTVYAFLRVPKKSWTITYLVLLILLSVLHSAVFIFIFGLVIYLIIARLGNVKIRKAETELILFSIFFVLWAQFVLYKKLILFHGPAVIWQNIPTELLSTHFAKLTIFTTIWQVGLATLIVGVYVIYMNLFREKSKEVYVLFGMIASVTILLWFHLIEFIGGLMFLGIVLLLLASKGFAAFVKFLKKTKLAKLKHLIITFVVLIFFFTSFFPTISGAMQELEQAVSEDEMLALKWLNENTPEFSTVVAFWDEGNLITAIAKRKNILDSYFFLQADASERLSDIKRLYTTSFQTEAVQLMDKYNASYIYLTPTVQRLFQKETLAYAEPPCFELVYSNSVKIFKKDLECHMKVVE